MKVIDYALGSEVVFTPFPGCLKPTKHVISQLDENYSVKVKVMTPGDDRVDGEIFWTGVVSVDFEAQTLVGRIDNDLVLTHIHGLEYNMEIVIPFSAIVAIA